MPLAITSAKTEESSTMPTINMHGLNFELDDPYTEGHQCTAAEAAELNKNRRTNIRNNWSPRVERARATRHPGEGVLEKITAELQAKLTEYAAAYSFGQKPTPAVVDPVQHEARRLARGKVITKLREQGHDLRATPQEQIESLVTDVLTKYPAFFDEARKRVEAYQNIAIAALEL